MCWITGMFYKYTIQFHNAVLLQIYMFRVWFACSGYQTGIMWLQCMWKMLWYLKWHVRMLCPTCTVYILWLIQIYMCRVWFAFSGYQTGIMWLQCVWKMLWYLKWHVRMPYNLTIHLQYVSYDFYRSMCGLPDAVDIKQASCGCRLCGRYQYYNSRYIYHAIQFNNTIQYSVSNFHCRLYEQESNLKEVYSQKLQIHAN